VFGIPQERIGGPCDGCSRSVVQRDGVSQSDAELDRVAVSHAAFRVQQVGCVEVAQRQALVVLRIHIHQDGPAVDQALDDVVEKAADAAAQPLAPVPFLLLFRQERVADHPHQRVDRRDDGSDQLAHRPQRGQDQEHQEGRDRPGDGTCEHVVPHHGACSHAARSPRRKKGGPEQDELDDQLDDAALRDAPFGMPGGALCALFEYLFEYLGPRLDIFLNRVHRDHAVEDKAHVEEDALGELRAADFGAQGKRQRNGRDRAGGQQHHAPDAQCSQRLATREKRLPRRSGKVGQPVAQGLE